MRGRRILSVLAAGAIALGGINVPAVATSGHASAAIDAAKVKPPVNAGKAKVAVTTPKGVAVTIVLSGKTRRVVAKPAKGRSLSTTLLLSAGAYSVTPQNVTVNGQLYAGKASPASVIVKKSKSVSLHVTYSLVPGARALHPTALGGTTVAMAWKAPKGATVVVRRTAGVKPATTHTRGVAIKVKGATASDKGLSPGSTYTYAVFTKIKAAWTGPVTMLVNTTPKAGSTEAAYVPQPGTVIATKSQVASAQATGNGVSLVLKSSVEPPAIGAAVVLPPSPSLAGGYLGKVVSIAPDGTLFLTGASMTDAFSFYHLAVPAFQSPQMTLAPTRTSLGAQPKSVLSKCPAIGGSLSQGIALNPSISLSGHLNASINTWSHFGITVPTGASLDMGMTATLTNAMTISVEAELACGFDFPHVSYLISPEPVPIWVDFQPSADLTVAAGVKLTNVGFTVSAGFNFAGSIGLTSGASFSGGPVLSAAPLSPELEVEGSVGFKLGGQLVVGPGAITKEAGVIVGISGEYDPLVGSFGPVFAASDSRHNLCLNAKLIAHYAFGVTAKAWLGDWSIDKSIDIGALSGDHPYGEWNLPSNCQDLAPTKIGDTVTGPGITPVNDSTQGSPDQWGHVDGFAPGTKTWVLSTGSISQVTGTPDTFASTNEGGPGDAALSAMAGHDTFDAAAYTANVVPTGHTLHVRFVFASEEYPEYVGSQYNDVMAVFVNGQNCAFVPGTTTPISVNTINGQTNSQYFVDNQSGASGYSTTMDGLTVPLTCNAPVTPGQQVTVRIAVADTSDGVYDSAVGLVDGGIWSD